MEFVAVTLFPQIFPGPLGEGVIGRALGRGVLSLRAVDLRDWTEDPHRTVDDRPFGGGGGMLLKPEPLFRAVEALRAECPDVPTRTVLLSPQGRPLRQSDARRLASCPRLILLCGRYEGVDERVREALVDEEVSIGDYVLSGGELPAMVLVEAIGRLIPGVLGRGESAESESFEEGILDFPQYTRPAVFRGMEVPPVLVSGNHAEIRRWRRQAAVERTRRRRPDLVGADEPR